MAPMIRVLVADDHPIVREGLRRVLALQLDMELVGEANDGAEAVRKALETRPDLILMDLQMPVKDGLAATLEINQALSDARIVILTADDSDERILAAIDAGAQGVVPKEYSADQLVHAIRVVSDGNTVLHPAIARRLMLQHEHTPAPEPHALLTARERDVLRQLARGLTDREVAANLNISIRTVAVHVRSILDKLQLANRTQAALYANEHGIDRETV